MNQSCRIFQIFQIFYQTEHLPFVDNGFIAYDNRSNLHPAWREYYLFHTLYKNGHLSNAEYSGVFSWKFFSKTGLKSDDVFAHMSEYPDSDVYLFDGRPEYTTLYRNPWHHGDAFHPGLIEKTRTLFNEIGISVDFNEFISARISVYCNFWVAKQNVWKEYIKLASKIYDHINSASEEKKNEYFYQNIDPREGHFCGYMPFIMERLFSSFLKMHPKLKVTPYLKPLKQRPDDYFVGYLPKLETVRRERELLGENPSEQSIIQYEKNCAPTIAEFLTIKDKYRRQIIK